MVMGYTMGNIIYQYHVLFHIIMIGSPAACAHLSINPFFFFFSYANGFLYVLF